MVARGKAPLMRELYEAEHRVEGAFSVGLPSFSVVVPCGRPSGRAARRPAARLLSAMTNLLWAAALAVRPHITQSGRAVACVRCLQAGLSSRQQADRRQAGPNC